MLLLILAIFLRVFLNPLANVFQKQLTSQNNHPLVVNFLTYFLLSVACLLVLGFIDIPALGRNFWIYSILGGIFGAVGNSFLVKALQMGDLSVLGPINSYKSVVGMIVGLFLLSEIPNFWGISGVALIIFGSYFVLDTTDERFSWKLLRKPEIQYRLWAMILTAIEAVFMKKVILASSVVLSFMNWCIFGAVFSFGILFLFRIKIKTVFTHSLQFKYLNKFLFLIACIGITQYSTTFIFDNMPVGYALSLFQLSTIVSIFFGYKFFQEKDIAKKILGSVMMIGGSVLIILMKG